ncbi:carbon-nitrogen hydrolase family protein [Bacteroidota bacterium]
MNKKTVIVAGAKLAVTRSVAENITSIKEAIDFASKENADILLTPEGSLSGYWTGFNQDEVKKGLEEVLSYAEKAGIGLALGTCFFEPDDGKCYNQIRFYDKMGEFLGFHSKILRCGDHFDPEAGEINRFATTPLRTFNFEGIIIGGLICNDVWANPECTTLPDDHLTQKLSAMGAQIIFHAVNGGRSSNEWSNVNWDFHSSNLRMRANSGNVWIVTADNSAPVDIRSSAPSGVVDPEGNWKCTSNDAGIDFFVYKIILE